MGSVNVYKYGLWRTGTITLFLPGSYCFLAPIDCTTISAIWNRGRPAQLSTMTFAYCSRLCLHCLSEERRHSCVAFVTYLVPPSFRSACTVVRPCVPFFWNHIRLKKESSAEKGSVPEYSFRIPYRIRPFYFSLYLLVQTVLHYVHISL
jgi:hypothetical protein